MAKIFLKFEKSVLRELPLNKGIFTIGRLPDNMIQIDNPAVSGHHAKIYWDGDHFIVEDNGSLNGTFVNDQRITKHTLNDDDVVLIGKHTIIFKAEPDKEVAAASTVLAKPTVRPLEGTLILDTKKARELIAQALAHPVSAAAAAAAPAPVSAAVATAAPVAAPPPRPLDKRMLGVLSVVSGKTDQREYVLTGKLTVIGKSDMATIRLKGWFAPKVAGAISHHDDKYFIAASDKKQKINVNGADISGQAELHEGDMIVVGKVKMTFNFSDSGAV